MPQVPFYIVDVFAERRYEGNPLAVFDCRDAAPSDAEMLAMAREVNFQESTFVLGGSVAEDFRVRIFTPEYEVPFAGHPTLGTAWVLANRLINSGKAPLTLQLGVGKVPVSWEGETAWLRTAQPQFGPSFDPAEVADLLQLPTEALRSDQPVRLVSTGLPYVVVPVASLAFIRQVRIDADACEAWLLQHQLHKSNSADQLTAAFYLFCEETERPENQLHTRMLCLENGKIVEDFATGSAASCLLAYLLAQREPSRESVRLRAEQGYEAGRLSLLQLDGQWPAPDTYQLCIGGQVQYVAQGLWRI